MAAWDTVGPVDVLLITAVKEEYEAALLVDVGAIDAAWQRETGPMGFEVAFRRFRAASGEPLVVALTRALDMRGVATANAAWPLMDKYNPRCLAMCGVCAGRRSAVQLGDVIVGDILYTYDTGALVVEYEAGKKKERYRGEPSPYQMPAAWKQRAESLDVSADASWLEERPRTLDDQGLWLLEQLSKGDAEPVKHPERPTRCADWKKVVERLRKLKHLKNRGLELTDKGRRYIEEVLLLHPEGLPAQPPFQVHVAPIATGNSVMRDPQIFDRLSESMRKVLGVEMEAAAIGAIAHLTNLPMLVMKGVMDHADADKDDGFKKFAARASAECLIAFLRENLSPTPRGTEHAQPVTAPALVYTERLPQTGDIFLGRDKELQRLDAAWEGPAKQNLVSVIAWGGTGKTSLVSRWLAQLSQAGWRGARRILAWSFYSQGASDEPGDSADEFMAWALRMLGDPAPSGGSPFDKASRLLKLVRAMRTLLILDGVEPLQYPPGPEEGSFKDKAFGIFLRGLGAANPGLCVVTSRMPLADVAVSKGTTFDELELDQLGPEEGVELLARTGVVGPREELRAVAEEFGGHALALTLLGRFLVEACEGDVRRRTDVGPLENEEVKGGHARRVITSYVKWLGAGPARDLLSVLGLFDRPARPEALRAVRQEPAIPGLTDRLAGIGEMEWNQAASRLRRARLIDHADPREPGTLDAHPLVREHFGEELRREQPDAWREGNRRLYQHYRAAAPALLKTLAEMEPLYAAVAHGCQAGLHEETLNAVYRKRICRGDLFYSINKLGAFGTDLAALGSFFTKRWTQPVASLTPSIQAWLLGLAASYLKALGRLREAGVPMRAGLDRDIGQGNWARASIQAWNLGDLSLSLGEMSGAIEFFRQCIEFADRDGDLGRRILARNGLARTFHQAGRIDEAEPLFAESEALQKLFQAQYPLIYGISRYWYGDFLLGRGATETVLNRMKKVFEQFHDKQVGIPIHTLALDNLLVGRAHLARARSRKEAIHPNSHRYFAKALEGLRQANQQDYLALGLLSRGDYFLFTGDLTSARTDLEEALDIGTRCAMRLDEADAHLGLALLHLTSNAPNEAHSHLALARRLVTETGYGRRQPELDELSAQLAAAQ